MKNYNYNERLNSKGMPKGWKPAPKVSTERGRRRLERSRKRHEHQFKRWSPSGTSYFSARVDNEARYYCTRVKLKRQRGGGQYSGCGCSVPSIS